MYVHYIISACFFGSDDKLEPLRWIFILRLLSHLVPTREKLPRSRTDRPCLATSQLASWVAGPCMHVSLCMPDQDWTAPLI
jgi:hypothetical protein